MHAIGIMTTSTHNPVPTIDIAPFTAGETPESARVVDAVRSACEEIGFFLITGHGFDEAVAGQLYDASRSFFNLPTEEKDRVAETGEVPGGLMHFGLAKEALAATLGGEPIPDLKEALDYGPGFLGDPWPLRPPDLEPAWRAYYEAISKLAATLRKVFATALGLPQGVLRGQVPGAPLVTARHRLPGAADPARCGAAPRRCAFGLWRADDSSYRRCAGRARGAEPLGTLVRSSAHPGLVRDQHRRRDDALDQRSLDLDPAPRGEPAGGSGSAHPPPVDCVLPQSGTRHRDRVSAAVSGGGGSAQVRARLVRRVRAVRYAPGGTAPTSSWSFEVSGRAPWLIVLVVLTIPVSALAETWRGLTVAPEHRCSPYDRKRDYLYPQSVEQDIVRQLGAVYGPYTGTCFASTRDTDIEHIVATSEAHDSGLCAVDRATRRRFAQDLRNLTLASPQVNRHQKSGKDAGEWVPNRNRCWFAGRVLKVKRAYGLTVDRREAPALERIFSQCYGTEMELIACTALRQVRERPDPRHLPGTPRSPDTTTTATAGSRARRQGGTGSRPCPVAPCVPVHARWGRGRGRLRVRFIACPRPNDNRATWASTESRRAQPAGGCANGR